jgi:hypothetical protein
MGIPKLKNITIIDEIRESVGNTNFIDVTKIVSNPNLVSIEEVIKGQQNQIKAFEEALVEGENKLKTETDAEKIEALIASIILNKELIENSKNYINQINPQNGEKR